MRKASLLLRPWQKMLAIVTRRIGGAIYQWNQWMEEHASDIRCVEWLKKLWSRWVSGRFAPNCIVLLRLRKDGWPWASWQYCTVVALVNELHLCPGWGHYCGHWPSRPITPKLNHLSPFNKDASDHGYTCLRLEWARTASVMNTPSVSQEKELQASSCDWSERWNGGWSHKIVPRGTHCWW